MKEDTTQVDATWLEKTGGYAKDMTLLDYFAGQTIAALVDSPDWTRLLDEFEGKSPSEFTAFAAWHIAKDMIKERNK